MTAGRTWVQAFRDDKITRYGWDFPSFGNFRFAIREYLLGALFAVWVARKKVITTDEGRTLAVATLPQKPTLSTHLLDIASLLIDCLLRLLQPRKGIKRAQSCNARIRDLVIKNLGEKKVKSMINLNLLAVAPELRGRGHGKALLQAVTKMVADEDNRGTWLVSVNIENTKLYEAHGFKTIGEVTVADDDADWKEGPILVYVMVREPASPKQ
ncbi:hypothetical protein CCMSSC00406_0008807 [Pleurotus cornucopiae]|uniref:Uncharacterized protein n=1 Tax=Pleurotus cornucopiae TaxID=5321 RepID=A0ACB7IIU6_PLECO|nr:hypothetical protein CCMSSC00406_0008807 [Pleurotus cornucopiae]